MINIVINNEAFTIPDNRDELTAGKAIAVERIFMRYPESVRKHVEQKLSESPEGDNAPDAINNVDVTNNGKPNDAGSFYADAISALGDIPKELCAKTDPQQIANFAEHYLRGVLSVIIAGPEVKYDGHKKTWDELSYMAGRYLPSETITARTMSCGDLIMLFGKAVKSGSI